MASEKDILEAFYCEYFRSPKLDEFVACGGELQPYKKHKRYGAYNKMLASYGYPEATKANTYEVVEDKTGEVVFTGTSRDIADEFGICDISKVAWMMHKNVRLQWKYRIRRKPFDVELVRKEIKK